MAADATSGQEQGLEEKAWAEARQTREKVSHLMGQYLLKGYRMLSVNCTECEVSTVVHTRTSFLVRPRRLQCSVGVVVTGVGVAISFTVG